MINEKVKYKMKKLLLIIGMIVSQFLLVAYAGPNSENTNCLSMTNLRANMEVHILDETCKKVEFSDQKDHLENTLTDEEIEEAKEREKEKAKERKIKEKQEKKDAREQAKADGTAMSLGELILRMVVAMIVVTFTVFTFMFVFSSAWGTLIIDMFVVFICMTLIGGERMMRWLNMDLQSLLLLMMLFFGGILGCCCFEWDKLAGIIYTAQMLFLTLEISGIVSSEVLDSWIMNVGLFASIPLGIIVIIFAVGLFAIPAGIGGAVVSLLNFLF